MNIKGTRIPVSSLRLDLIPIEVAVRAVVDTLKGCGTHERNPSVIPFPFGIEKLEAALEDLGMDEVYERVLDRRFKAREVERAAMKAKAKEAAPIIFTDATQRTFKVEAGDTLPKWVAQDRPFLGRDSAFRKLAVLETLEVALNEGAGFWGPSDGIGVEFIVRCLGEDGWAVVSSPSLEYKTA